MAVSEEYQEKVLAEATSATPNYTVDMNGEQFKNVDADIEKSWNEYNQTVGGMIGGADKFYEDLKTQSQEWADKQAALQQQQTDFTIEKIEQQKEQAHKDYLKEQSASYVDWQKQSNQYGTQAEKMASAGLTNTGFSESSQVAMYNAYQNRVAVAREVMSQAKMNYDNNIKEAMLQNNATLAQIYADAYKEQLQLALEGYLHNEQLVLNLADKKIEFENTKWNRYQDVLNQINTENALAEEIRQYNETQKWQTEQNELDRNFKAQEAELDRKFQAEQAEINRKFEEAQAELDRKHDYALLEAKTKAERELANEQHKRDMEKLKKQQEYELEQLNKQLENEKSLLRYKQSLNSSPNSQSLNGKPTSQYNYTPVSGAPASIKPTGFTGSTLSEAQSYVISRGVPENMASGIYSAPEWSGRKTGNSTAAVIKNSNSYQEYLKLQTQYLIDEYGRRKGNGVKF